MELEVLITHSICNVNNQSFVLGYITDNMERNHALDQLCHNEEKFRSFIEQSHEGMFLLKNDGEIIEWNRAMEIITGISRMEALGEKIWLVLNKLLTEEQMNSLRIPAWFSPEKLPSVMPVFREVDIKSASGKDLTVQYNIFSIELKDGYCIGGLILDITDRKMAERVLEEKERFYRHILENIQDFVIVTNADNKIVYVSPSHKNIAGYEEDELLGRDSFDFVYPEDRQGLTNHVIKNISAGYFKHKDFRIIHKDGRLLWVECTGKIITDQQGKYNGVIYSGRDISERKNIEEREKKYLRNTEFLLRTAVQLVDFPRNRNIFAFTADNLRYLHPESLIFVAEIKDSATAVCKAFAGDDNIFSHILKILGFSPVERVFTLSGAIQSLMSGEIEKFPEGIYSFSSADLSDEKIAAIREIFPMGTVYGIGFISDNKLIGTVVIVYPEGKTISNRYTTKLFVQQVSLAMKRIQMEEEKNKAEESNRLKSAFLANMSHEIRTPMNAILGFCQLMRMGNLSDLDRDQLLDSIDVNSEQLLNVINDIIDIAKIESGQLRILNRPFNLNSLIDDLWSFFQSDRRRMNKHDIELKSIKTMPDLLCNIITDDMRLKQILINLISNAYKFTDKGSIEFGYMAAKNGMLKFFVKDTGSGIEKAHQHLIFERFKQADDSATRVHKGTGLGLAICKELVEIMGGTIWVESIPGMGSTFYFTLPFVPADKQSLSYAQKRNKKYNWKNKTVLLVEDHLKNYLYLKMVLEDTVVSLIHVETATDAIMAVQNDQSIDMVLMDIQLPDFDGYQATRRILDIRPDLPVIAQTAYAMEGDRDKALAAGCVDYIAKPYDYRDLLEKMEKFFS